MMKDIDLLPLHGFRSLPFGSTMEAVRSHLGEPAEIRSLQQIMDSLNEIEMKEPYEPVKSPSTQPLFWRYEELSVDLLHIDGCYRVARYAINRPCNTQYQLFGIPFSENEDHDELSLISLLKKNGISQLSRHCVVQDFTVWRFTHGVDVNSSESGLDRFGWSIFDYRFGHEVIDREAYARLQTKNG